MPRFDEVFDRMVDAMGADVAADTMRQLVAYANHHRGCDLSGGVKVIRERTGVYVEFAHDPACPALLTEGAHA